MDKASKSKVINDANNLKSTLKSVLGTIGVTISLAGVIKFGKDSLDAASNLEQMEMKFNTVFGEMERAADQWASSFADSIGRSKTTIKTYMADNQNLLVGMGMARDQASEMTEQMVKAAIDLASFNNISDDDAVNAMSKALMGETESAKRLGAVLNENTIATAMETLGLKGKFDALDEATKMQVRYQAIMNQSQDSIDDAANSIDTYEGKLRAFNAKLNDVREIAGKFLLPYATKGLELLNKIVGKVQDFAERLGDANEEGTTASRIMKGFQAATDFAGRAIGKVVEYGRKAIEMVGGSENALRLLSVVIGAIMAYKIGGKILGFVQGLGSISKVLSGINVKALLIIGVIVLLVLLVQDFISFLQGKDSIFGKLLEKAGLDADEVREKFKNFGIGIAETFGYIKAIAEPIISGLRSFWDEHGSAIMQGVGNVVNFIVAQLSTLASLIEPFVSYWLNLFKGFFALLSGDTEGAMEAFQAAFESGLEFVHNLVTGWWNSIDELFGGLPSKALTWGKDMIQGFINGITEKISALKEKITDIGNTIKEKLHFSKPDNGPLADADKWTPDMMDLFTSGIESGKAKLKNAVVGVAGLIKGVVTGEKGQGIQALAGSATASQSTVGGITNSNRSITQVLNFSNTFNGGDPETQRQASSQMNKNAHDASTYLADALAFGR
ncbi:MAG: hypothetical protein OSJ60_08710 [Lachnospiraceae bacterium]|nr:hypothetical protein [Lachnospiraceae bacterium]